MIEKNPFTVRFGVGIELHHGIVGRDARLERRLASHLREEVFSGLSVTHTTTCGNDGTVSDRTGLDTSQLQLLEELDGVVGLASLGQFGDDGVVEVKVRSDVAGHSFLEKSHSVGGIVSGRRNVLDQSTISVRRR